jgi:hypothetical protein
LARFGIAFWALSALGSGLAAADWPTLHGDAQHTGLATATLKPPFRLAWARHFVGERLGTAMEPIVGAGAVFVATHGGNLYALDAAAGELRWRFQARGPFLHSPAFADDLVVAGSCDGSLYAVEAGSGRMRWRAGGGHGGFSASPVVAEGTVFIGSRQGEFLAVELRTGKPRWRQSLRAPIRQTAAVAEGRVCVSAEDLRIRCFDARTGKVVWVSEPLIGQTARDYYPVIVKAGGRTYVIVRTNPVINMAQLLARDRHRLCVNAGVDDSHWQRIDAWIKSDAARGNAALWEKEQQAIVAHLQAHREARTFFVLDGVTGKEAMTAPVLWIAGCQGVGAPPALTADGRLLVFYRSAYGNWNYGVAPLVALGLLDLSRNRVTPLFHQSGPQPPWNTFWGTADESQNFVVAGGTVIIVHQGNLSGFDLQTNQLFPICGERDTYGGFRSPPWARNEWHGPGRGGVAVTANRLYWITGSRVLCLISGQQGKPAEPAGLAGSDLPAQTAPPAPPPAVKQLRRWLADTTRELLSARWAPLFVEPGLAGRDFSFAHSGELFAALAWAYPHLPGKLQSQVSAKLAAEWAGHAPFTKAAWYSLKEGTRRELFWSPDEVLSRLGNDPPPHPFANVYAAWLYAQRCGQEKTVLAAWPQLRAGFDDFLKTGWRLDGAKGDRWANRYLASLTAFAQLAAKASDTNAATLAEAKAAETAEALAAWWKRAAAAGTMTTFRGSGELDPFIGGGDAISLRLAPHRHKVALFDGLTPQVAVLMKAKAPEAVARVWEAFAALYATWWLAGEERQVHFGENFVDPPDLALGAFQALAWLQNAPPTELGRRVDLPFCRADLYHVAKLAITLDIAQQRRR